jgi:putative transposase
MLNVIDEFTRECIGIRVERKLKAVDVIDVLSDLFMLRGIPTLFVPTTAQNSSPRRCAKGSRWWEPRPPT